jgi:hypothetical protein
LGGTPSLLLTASPPLIPSPRVACVTVPVTSSLYSWTRIQAVTHAVTWGISSMLNDIVIPSAMPAKKVPGYQMPEDTTNLLSWDFVATHLAPSYHYWLNTICADGRPHAVPVWGIWYNNRVHFEGSMKTTWARNLVRDPRITVHLPNGEQVVIIEGVAHIIEDNEIDSDEWNRLDTQFQSKYQVDKGSPYWYVQPRKVLAWNGGGLQTMTRWVFSSR